jgi:hypothetical protein
MTGIVILIIDCYFILSMDAEDQPRVCLGIIRRETREQSECKHYLMIY